MALTILSDTVTKMVRLTRTQFYLVQDSLEEFQFEITNRQALDEFMRQLRLAQALHESLPWYKRLLARAPSYNRLVQSYPQVQLMDRLAVIQSKMNDMDDWETTFSPTEDDIFYMSEEDMKFLNEHLLLKV